MPQNFAEFICAPRYNKKLTNFLSFTIADLFVNADVIEFSGRIYGGSSLSDKVGDKRSSAVDMLRESNRDLNNLICSLTSRDVLDSSVLVVENFSSDIPRNRKIPKHVIDPLSFKNCQFNSPSDWLLEGDIISLGKIAGISEGTEDQYKNYWHWWPVFLIHRNQLKFLYLIDLNKQDKGSLLALFVIWLATKMKCSESSISLIFSAMRYAFIHARIDHECFSDPIISYAKKSYRESSRISSEKRLLGKHGGKLRLPANFDFLLKIEEWRDHEFNAKGKKLTVAEILKRKCSYLACKF